MKIFISKNRLDVKSRNIWDLNHRENLRKIIPYPSSLCKVIICILFLENFTILQGLSKQLTYQPKGCLAICYQL